MAKSSGAKIGMAVGIGGAVVGVVVAILAVASPGTLFKACGLAPKVKGTFEAKGGHIGSFTFEPNHCRSGERQGFFGVYLFKKGDNDHFVKVARNPATGKTAVSVKIPGTDKMRVMTTCKVLTANMHRTNTRVNKIWVMKGSVNVDCPSENFKGQATFDNCY